MYPEFESLCLLLLLELGFSKISLRIPVCEFFVTQGQSVFPRDRTKTQPHTIS